MFAPRGWLLSAAVSPSRFRLEDAYDVQRLARNLDFINLMTFDLHAERDRSADHHAPLLQRKHDKGLNVFYSVVSIQLGCKKCLFFRNVLWNCFSVTCLLLKISNVERGLAYILATNVTVVRWLLNTNK